MEWLADPSVTDLKICIDESGPPEGGEFGTPPFMLRENTYCSDCKRWHDIELCPDCGAFIYEDFGLGRWGYGFHKGCEAFCGWAWAKILPHDAE